MRSTRPESSRSYDSVLLLPAAMGRMIGDRPEIVTDPVARALGRSWAQAGHEVLFTFSFDGTDFDALAAGTGGRHGTLAEGPAAEVVLLAAPGPR